MEVTSGLFKLTGSWLKDNDAIIDLVLKFL